MGSISGLRPLHGSARQIEQLVDDWLREADPSPLWVRTSGSTGEPKDVALSSSALCASARSTLAYLGGPGRWLLALPAHYVAGLQVIVRSLIVGSSAVALDEHADLSAATDALGDGRRYLAAVPTQLTRWLADPGDLAALRTYDAVLVGGATPPGELVETARRKGVAVVTTYGMSETCGGCVYDGRPLDGVAVALDADGRIRISGPMLFDGYVGRPDLTDTALVDGWLVTPDVGHLDSEGALVVTGRVDDVVVSGGVNVPLAAIERVVSRVPGIAQVAVVGAPDAEWGTRVVAVVVLDRGGAQPPLDALREAVATEHPRAWAPREVLVVDRIPMLASGKVDRMGVQHLVETR